MSSEGPFIPPPPQPLVIDPPLGVELPPTVEETSREQENAIQELLKEINSMDQTMQTENQEIRWMDQATQTEECAFSSPSVPVANEGPMVRREANGMVRYPDGTAQFNGCCPIHGDKLVDKTSPKGFHYFRYPHFDSFDQEERRVVRKKIVPRLVFPPPFSRCRGLSFERL